MNSGGLSQLDACVGLAPLVHKLCLLHAYAKFKSLPQVGVPADVIRGLCLGLRLQA